MKKVSGLISVLLILVMCCGFITPVFAAETEASDGESTPSVVLNAEAAEFSVTIPTGLPVTVLADGTVVEPDAVKIINNSSGAVQVQNVTIESQNDWTLVDFDTELTAFKVNEKKIGLQINSANEKTADDGAFAFDATQWAIMTATDGADGGTDEYEFTYAAILAPQSNAITDATVANVVFTVGWDKSDSGNANATQLNAPTVALDGDTLTITSGDANTQSYAVYVDGELKTTVAAAASEATTVKGVWVFNETISVEEAATISLPFTSNGTLLANIGVLMSGQTPIGLAYADESFNIDITVYDGTTWADEAYRTIDFGETEQEVSDEFYTWLTANAIQQASEEVDSIAFDLSTLNLEAGTYSVTVKAVADGYADSVESEAVNYAVESA